MKLEILSMSTHPKKDTNYWQVVLFPTVSIYKTVEDEGHIAVNLEWLFWNITILTYSDDKAGLYKLED